MAAAIPINFLSMLYEAILMKPKPIVPISFFLFLLLFSGCDRANVIQIPDYINLGEVHKLGTLFGWTHSDNWLFSYSPQTGGGLIQYDYETGKVTPLNLPDLNALPYARMNSQSSVIGYTNREENLTFYDLKKGRIITEIEGYTFAFSSKNDHIAVWRDQQLFIVDLNSGEERLAYELDPTITREVGKYVFETAWRPGANEVAFILHYFDRTSEDTDIFDDVILLDIDSGSITMIDSMPLYIEGLSWAPNGKYLAYSFGGNDQVTKLRIKNIEQNCIVEDVLSKWPATAFWSPDGDLIVHSYISSVLVLDIMDYFGVIYSDLTCGN